MKMNKLASACFVGATLLASSWAAHAAPQDPNMAVINVTGKVLASTCTVSWTDASKTVAMGEFDIARLTTVKETAGLQSFSLTVSGCDTHIKKLHVTASGNSDPDDTSGEVFKNKLTGSDAAKGVGVVLLGGDSAIKLKADSSNSVDYEVDQSSNAGAMTFATQLRATKGGPDIEKGDIATDIILNIAYQ